MSVNPVLFLILMVFAGGAMGRVARGPWRLSAPKLLFAPQPDQIPNEPFLDRIVLDTSLGLGILSLIFFAMAALHQCGSADTFMIALIWGVVVGVPALSWELFVFVDWAKQRRWPSLATVVWGILFICVAVVVLVPALAPPSGSDWDSLAYHLAIPKLYLQHGGFYYIDFASHSNFPFLVEMLYMPALSMDSPAGAKLVHYLYGVLLVLAVVILVRKHFNAKAAPLAALAIAGMPIVMWEATMAYIDLATALYTVIAVYLLLEYFDKAEHRSLIGCGIAAGFAASTKMTGLALIPMLAIWLLIDRWAAERRVEWKRALMFGGVALLVCSPWYIKTLIYTGNPVYPFFYSIFGGKDWAQELAHSYTILQAKFGMGHDLGSFVMLPFDLTFHSERFYDTPWLLVGPIFLVAVPLLLVAKYKSRKLLGLTLFFLAQIAIWFALTQQSRYLIAAFAILAVIIAAIAYSDERLKVTRIALYVTFAATALFCVLMLGFQIGTDASVVFGYENQDQYLSRTLPIYPAEKWINENAPPRSKIALFGDTRGFYLDRDYVWADPGHNVRFTRDFASVDEFTAYMKGQGITHAIVNYQFFPMRVGAGGTAERVYEAIDQGLWKQVYPVGDERGSAAVYRIR